MENGLAYEYLNKEIRNKVNKLLNGYYLKGDIQKLLGILNELEELLSKGQFLCIRIPKNQQALRVILIIENRQILEMYFKKPGEPASFVIDVFCKGDYKTIEQDFVVHKEEEKSALLSNNKRVLFIFPALT
jgi:hypothetical protein